MMLKTILLITLIINIFTLQPISLESVTYTWKSFANLSCTSEIKGEIKIFPEEINLSVRKEEKGILYSVTYENKLVIVKSAGRTNLLICFNADNLGKLWSYDTQTLISDPPICYNGNIYFFSNKLKSITSVKIENGKKEHTVEANYNRNPYPLNARDGKIFYSSNTHILCYNSSTLDKLWECSIEDINFASCIYENYVIVTTFNKMYNIDTNNGKILWEIEIPSNLGTQTIVYKNNIYKVFENDIRSYSLVDGSLVAIHQEEGAYTISICNDNLILTKFNLGMKSLSLDFKNTNWHNKEIIYSYLNTYPLVINGKIFFVFFVKNLRRYRLAMLDGKGGNILWISDYSLYKSEINYTENRLLFYHNDFINCYTLSNN